MSQLRQPHQSVLARGINGLHLNDVSEDTIASSSNFVLDSRQKTEPIVPPICHSSTYKIKLVDDYLKAVNEGGYVYSRLNTFTGDAVEVAINDVERGMGTLVFNTGMSAIATALFCFLKNGDHIVVNNPCYSGLYDIVVKMFPKFGIEHTFVPAGCPAEEYRKNVKSNTRMLYAETPCNPSMDIQDLAEFGELGRSLDNVLTMIDGTFASPYLQQAIKCGIDISMHSCTKYLGGHSDLTAGSLTFSSVELWQEAVRYRTTFGTGLSAHDASLLLRGIKTLPLRMKRHSSNAQKIAEYLEKHPKIDKVSYPGLLSHAGHETAKKQMKMFSGMVTFEMKGGEQAGRILVEGVRLIKLAVSLGGVESLVELPAAMTHGPAELSDEDRHHCGISGGLVRLSVGLEDPDDLIRDLQQALNKIP